MSVSCPRASSTNMCPSMNFRSHLLFTVGFLIVCGCNRSPVVPVSGTISFPDRDTPEVCRLSFVPLDTDEGVAIRPNGATMEADGTYRLTPHQGVEGLLPGRYSIRVSYFDLKPNGNPDREADWKEYTYDAGELLVEEGSSAIKHDIEVVD